MRLVVQVALVDGVGLRHGCGRKGHVDWVKFRSHAASRSKADACPRKTFWVLIAGAEDVCRGSNVHTEAVQCRGSNVHIEARRYSAATATPTQRRYSDATATPTQRRYSAATATPTQRRYSAAAATFTHRRYSAAAASPTYRRECVVGAMPAQRSGSTLSGKIWLQAASRCLLFAH
eukprot:366544-Chlamydomonas_euryale.AAC.5